MIVEHDMTVLAESSRRSESRAKRSVYHRLPHAQRTWATRLALYALGAGLLSAVVAANADERPTGDEPLVLADAAMAERVNDEFNLADSIVATLSFDPTPSVSQRILIPTDEDVFTLDIGPYSVRSAEHYEIKYQLPDGSFQVVDPGPLRTVRGTVEGLEDAVVAGLVADDGMSMMILLPNGDRWWVEPIADRVANAGPHDHVIYRDRDSLGGGGTCATEDRARRSQTGGDPSPLGGPCNSAVCVAEMACDSDVEYFQRWGNGVENRINFITNTMNLQYEREVGLTHQITTIIVRRTEPDPYESMENHPLLLEFRDHWVDNQQHVPRDVAQLFTGRSIIGTVIGEALTLGGICSDTLGYCFVQSDFNNSAQCATDLSAHELGHLWDADHCACSRNTMNPSITCSNTFHSTDTRPDITGHRDSRVCLSDLAPVTVFPFKDSFTTVQPDPSMWVSRGATNSTLARDPPSPPLSLQINENGRVATGFMNTEGVERVGVEYWWQRAGTTGSPEQGEDLIMDYHSAGGVWAEVDRQLGDPGNGGDDEPFVRSCVILPADASYDGLQLRMLIDGDALSISDNFFVDDFRVMDAAELLSIAKQPDSTCACAGDDAGFSVEAAGEPPFTYRWRRNGLVMHGETNPTLVFSPAQAFDFDTYSVEVRNECGTIESQNVELRQSNTPNIVVPPQGTTLSEGGTLFLSYFASGGSCNSTQWYFNGAPITGGTNQFLTIADVQCAHQGCYSVDVFSECGSVTSGIAEVRINGDCGPFSCEDTTAPVILHETGLAGQTRPFTGFIDPRRESDNGSDLNQGITEVTILFSEPVQAVGGGLLTAESFIVTETGEGVPPDIVSIDDTQMSLVVLTLDRPITLREYTTIQAVVQDMAAVPNVMVDVGNLGPELDESDRVDIGFLPADVNQNGCANPLDVTRFRQIVNDIFNPSIGVEEDYADINRNGSINPLDLTALRQLFFGVGPAVQVWDDGCMNNPRP